MNYYKRTVFQIFEDFELANAIMKELQLDNSGLISDDELSTITELNLTNYEITNLDGIQHLIGLKKLIIDNNKISNIEPISSLESLTDLSMNKNFIIDITPLKKILKLRRLNIANNKISDIDCLYNLIFISELTLNGNDIVNLGVTISFRNLKTLSLDLNRISKSEVAKVTEHFKNIKIENISIEPSEQAMENVAIENNNIKHLTNSKSSVIDNNKQSTDPMNNFRDIFADPILREFIVEKWKSCGSNEDIATWLKTINEITLDDAGVTSIKGLEALKNLKKLSLKNNNLTNLNALKELKNIEHFWCDGNNISDASPLCGLNKLVVLILDWQKFHNLEILLELPNISVFTKKSIIANLNHSKKQQKSDSKTKIIEESINGISEWFSDQNLRDYIISKWKTNGSPTDYNTWFTTIAELDIKDKDIRNLSGIWKLSNLRKLDLSNNPISIVEPVAGLKFLESLQMDLEKIKDLEKLDNLIYLPPETKLQIAKFALINNPPIRKCNLNLNKDFLIRLKALGFKDENLRNCIQYEWRKAKSPVDLVAWFYNTKELNISGKGINDISGISRFKNLQSLDFSENQISSLKPLQTMNNIKHLVFHKTSITKIEPIDKLNSLETLQTDWNQIKDIHKIEKLANLNLETKEHVKNKTYNSTDIQTTNEHQLKNYFPDHKMATVIAKQLNKTTSDEVLIGELENIEILRLDGLGICNIEGMQHLKNLSKLSLNDNNIATISQLETLENVVQLSLNNNIIEDVMALRNFEKLEVLSIANNDIYNLDILKYLPNIEFIRATGNAIESEITADDFVKLQTLHVDVPIMPPELPSRVVPFSEFDTKKIIDKVFAEQHKKFMKKLEKQYRKDLMEW